MLRAADGHGAYWTDAIALADDHEPADGTAVLTFWQAQDKARLLVRGEDAPATARPPWRCARRLRTRSGDTRRRRSPMRRVVRKLIPAALLAKPVGLLTFTRAAALARRSARPAQGVDRSTRTCKSLKAALNLAAAHDQRIGNSAVWRTLWRACPTRTPPAVSDCPSATCARSSPPPMRSRPKLGLWAEVAATTGARPSQIARLDVADLQDERDDARLMMPSSRKGQGHQARRAPPGADPGRHWQRSCGSGRRQAARGGDPLLLQSDGTRWQHADHVRPFARRGAAPGCAGVTAYALRHSSDHPRAARRRAGPGGRGHSRHLRSDD